MRRVSRQTLHSWVRSACWLSATAFLVLQLWEFVKVEEILSEQHVGTTNASRASAEHWRCLADDVQTGVCSLTPVEQAEKFRAVAAYYESSERFAQEKLRLRAQRSRFVYRLSVVILVFQVAILLLTRGRDDTRRDHQAPGATPLRPHDAITSRGKGA